MSDYTPTIDEVAEALAFAYGYGLGGLPECADDIDPTKTVKRWLAEHDRQVAERVWWEACLRIANGENHLDIAHVYQKQSPYLEAQND